MLSTISFLLNFFQVPFSKKLQCTAYVYVIQCIPLHTIVASLFLWGVNWLSENIEHSIDAYVEAPSAMTTLIKNQNI